MAKKVFRYDNVSFSPEFQKEFEAKSKDEQISYLAERLNPKDELRAKQLLKGVENGNISSGNDKEAGTANAKNVTGGRAKGNTKESGTDPGESK